jgi:hypothetical protein
MASLLKRISELKQCDKCADLDYVEGANGGYRRCDCVRGKLLEKADGIKRERQERERSI